METIQIWDTQELQCWHQEISPIALAYITPDGKVHTIPSLTETVKQASLEGEAAVAGTPKADKPLSTMGSAQTEDSRPKCKVHGTRMKYNAAEDRMECKEDGCNMVATKARTFRSELGSELGSARPVVYRGRLQFVADDEGDLYLYLKDANAMVSLASFIPQLDGIGDMRQAFLERAEVYHKQAREHAEDVVRKRRLARDAEQAARRFADRQKTMYSGTQIFGHALPPHKNTPEDALQVKRRFESMTQTEQQRMRDRQGQEAQGAYLFDLTWPCEVDGNLLRFYIYTKAGVRVGDFTVTPHMDWTYDVHSAAQHVLEETLETNSAGLYDGDLPIYTWIDGWPLTLYGVKERLKEHGRQTYGAHIRMVYNID